MDHPHPNIRYTRTEDGVDIAYWEIGEGKPVIILNLFSNSHAELEWTVPSMASFYLDMAKRYRVIRFDPRGISLSGEPPGGWGARTQSGAQQGFSLREMCLDISAVASALGIDDFALFASAVQGPVAIEYAATQTDVSELILSDAVAATANGWIGPVMRAEIAFNQVESASGPVFTIWERIGPPSEVDRLVAMARASLARDRRVAMTEDAQLEWNAESRLGDVSVPTLILTTRNGLFDSLPDARKLASGIQGSRMVSLDGDRRSSAPFWIDRAQILAVIDEFLQPGVSIQPPSEASFRTVVFTDIVGSTEYTRRVGDEAARVAIRELEQKIAGLAADHKGRVVKNLGDGSLVSFRSNSSAIAFALEVQDQCSDGPLQLRVGMTAGEPIQEEGDIHGAVVAHASRIGDLGDAGDVVVSDTVRRLAEGKGFAFEPMGEVSLKGFDEPERVWKASRP